MRANPVLLELPEPILQRMGTIVFQWALFDHYLTKAISILLDVDIKQTRVTLGMMKVMTKVDTVIDLLQLHEIESVRREIANNKATLQNADRIRNLLAHGPWTRDDDGDLVVISYAGTWKEDGGKKVSRRIKPTGAPVTEAWLDKNIESFIGANRWIATLLHQMIAALPSSPNRSL